MALSDTFYLEQAGACAEAAARAILPNQRDKFLSAQAAWEGLATKVQKMQEGRAERLAEIHPGLPPAEPVN